MYNGTLTKPGSNRTPPKTRAEGHLVLLVIHHKGERRTVGDGAGSLLHELTAAVPRLGAANVHVTSYGSAPSSKSERAGLAVTVTGRTPNRYLTESENSALEPALGRRT